MANPNHIREGRYIIDMEIKPERLKESGLQMIEMFGEFDKIVELFGRDNQGGTVKMEELQKEYLQTSGRPDELFTSKIYQQLEEKSGEDLEGMANQNMKPTVRATQLQTKGLVT